MTVCVGVCNGLSSEVELRFEFALLVEEEGPSGEVVGDAVLGFVGGEFNSARSCPDADAACDFREMWSALVSEVEVATELRADVSGFGVRATEGFEISEDVSAVVLVAEDAIEAAGNAVAWINEAHFDCSWFPAVPHAMGDEGFDPLGVVAHIAWVSVEEEIFESSVDGITAWFPDVLGAHDLGELCVGLIADDLGYGVFDPVTTEAVAM